MSKDLTTVRRRVEMQGFVGLTDDRLRDLDSALRFAPAICMLLAAVALATGETALLWALIPWAALGALLPRHPFDALYDHGVRRLLGTARIPPHRAPRRFACGIATVWLAATATLLELGAWIAGIVLGVLFVVTASVPVLTGFCVPSWIFRKLLGGRFGCSAAGCRIGPR